MSGISIAVIYAVAAAVALTGNASSDCATVFDLAQLIPIAFILASFKLYRGPKRVHYLQIPNVLSLLWGGFIGGMAVTGVWL